MNCCFWKNSAGLSIDLNPWPDFYSENIHYLGSDLFLTDKSKLEMKWSNCQKSAGLKNDRSEMKMILMYSSWFSLKILEAKLILSKEYFKNFKMAKYLVLCNLATKQIFTIFPSVTVPHMKYLIQFPIDLFHLHSWQWTIVCTTYLES